MSATGIRGNAERSTYADFLDEASAILAKPALQGIAEQFRTSAKAWGALAHALLPDDVALFKETRELMTRKDQLFIAQGGAALSTIEQINERLIAHRDEIIEDFPLDEDGIVALRENIAEHLLRIHDIEEATVITLREAMT